MQYDIKINGKARQIAYTGGCIKLSLVLKHEP